MKVIYIIIIRIRRVYIIIIIIEYLGILAGRPAAATRLGRRGRGRVVDGDILNWGYSELNLDSIYFHNI